MRRVVLESPWAGDELRHAVYARACLKDSLQRGEAPLASHLLYTQVLDDKVKEERRQGIDAGHAWMPAADALVVYMDLGFSAGMVQGIEMAGNLGLPVEKRSLGGEWAS